MCRRTLAYAAILVVLAGCGGLRDDLPSGMNGFAPAKYSFNISAGDLFDEHTAQHRLHNYLTWIESQGYKKQARIICDPFWGPRKIEPLWLPVFRQRGWKVLCIMDQAPAGPSAEDIAMWTRHVISAWGDILLPVVEPINEPHLFGRDPLHTVDIIRKVGAVARKAGFQIVQGGFGDHPSMIRRALEHYEKGGLRWTGPERDVDILSIHVTESLNRREVEDGIKLYPRGLPIWITEGAPIHTSVLQEAGLDVVENFLYTCNADPQEELNRCPKIK